MQRILTIGIGIVVVLGIVAGAVWWMLSPAKQAQAPVAQTFGTGGTYTTSVGPTAPTPTTASNTRTVTSIEGGAITTNDFLKDPATVSDPHNSGHYYLAQTSASTTTDYRILYVDSDQSFTVVLLAKPLSQTRQAAEQILLQKLGISVAQACALRYWVSVPYEIDPVNSGKNLGFSFCPGATILP